MKFSTSLILAASLMAGAAHALPNGEYRFTGDGGKGGATINGSDFSIGFGNLGGGGPACMGSMEGKIKPAGSNTWRVTAPTHSNQICVVTITHQGDHYTVSSNYECSYFSGVSCSMDGWMEPEAGVPMAVAGPNTDVLAASFKNQTPDFRRRMQQSLAAKGHYIGAIDGAYGPNTEGAILAAAKAQNIDLTTNDGVAKILGALLSGL